MALVHGLEIMTQPNAAHALCRDDQRIAFEYFVGDTDPAAGWQFQLQSMTTSTCGSRTVPCSAT